MHGTSRPGSAALWHDGFGAHDYRDVPIESDRLDPPFEFRVANQTAPDAIEHHTSVRRYLILRIVDNELFRPKSLQRKDVLVEDCYALLFLERSGGGLFFGERLR
jgi:hypothetical protein